MGQPRKSKVSAPFYTNPAVLWVAFLVASCAASSAPATKSITGGWPLRVEDIQVGPFKPVQCTMGQGLDDKGKGIIHRIATVFPFAFTTVVQGTSQRHQVWVSKYPSAYAHSAGKGYRGNIFQKEPKAPFRCRGNWDPNSNDDRLFQVLGSWTQQRLRQATAPTAENGSHRMWNPVGVALHKLADAVPQLQLGGDEPQWPSQKTQAFQDAATDSLVHAGIARYSEWYVELRSAEEHTPMTAARKADVLSPYTITEQLAAYTSSAHQHNCAAVASRVLAGCERAYANHWINAEQHTRYCVRAHQNNQTELEWAVENYCKKEIVANVTAYDPLVSNLTIRPHARRVPCALRNFDEANWPQMSVFRLAWEFHGSGGRTYNSDVFLSAHNDQETLGRGFHTETPAYGTNCTGRFSKVPATQRRQIMSGHTLNQLMQGMRRLASQPEPQRFVLTTLNATMEPIWGLVMPIWNPPLTEEEHWKRARLGSKERRAEILDPIEKALEYEARREALTLIIALYLNNTGGDVVEHLHHTHHLDAFMDAANAIEYSLFDHIKYGYKEISKHCSTIAKDSYKTCKRAETYGWISEQTHYARCTQSEQPIIGVPGKTHVYSVLKHICDRYIEVAIPHPAEAREQRSDSTTEIRGTDLIAEYSAWLGSSEQQQNDALGKLRDPSAEACLREYFGAYRTCMSSDDISNQPYCARLAERTLYDCLN